LPPLIAQEEFDAGDVATVVALVVAINQAVMALGPVTFGMLHDATNDYLLPFSMAAAAQVVAALILLAGRRGRRLAAAN
jgi:cyanate permease